MRMNLKTRSVHEYEIEQADDPAGGRLLPKRRRMSLYEPDPSGVVNNYALFLYR